MAQPPILVSSIPPQSTLEGAEITPIDCKEYITSMEEDDGEVRFFAQLADGSPIPNGLFCSDDGIISGAPKAETHGKYEIQIVAANNAETPLETIFNLVILEQVPVKPGQPILMRAIPPMIVNEGAALGPVDLKEYLKDSEEKLHFQAELISGAPLPKGLICTGTGILSGIPAKGTVGGYEVSLTIQNESGFEIKTELMLTIKERIEMGGEPQFYTNLKTQIWDALGKNQPVPEFAELFNRQLTAVEIYYLMQRFATLTIYDVYNLEPPSEPVPLTLEGASPHYVIYDRGSCIVGAPKDLFSHERTPEDALITAKVMAKEVFKRGWTIELVGFQKMMRASWIELQVLGEKQGKYLDVLHYTPTMNDLKLFETELKAESIFGRKV